MNGGGAHEPVRKEEKFGFPLVPGKHEIEPK